MQRICAFSKLVNFFECQNLGRKCSIQHLDLGRKCSFGKNIYLWKIEFARGIAASIVCCCGSCCVLKIELARGITASDVVVVAVVVVFRKLN